MYTFLCINMINIILYKPSSHGVDDICISFVLVLVQAMHIFGFVLK